MYDLLHAILGNGFLPLGRADDIDDDVASLHQLFDVFESSLIRDLTPALTLLSLLCAVVLPKAFLASTTMTLSSFSVSPLS